MNKMTKGIIKNLFSVCFLWSCCYACIASDNTVYLRGSTTLAPIARSVAEAYMAEHPDARILVDTGGTERGYKSVINHTTDVAMVSGEYCDVSPYECKNGILLKKESLGYALIKVVVHKSNLISNLTTNQLRDIFTGRINNWSDLGGNNEDIHVYLNPPRSGISSTWKKLIFKNEESYTPKGLVKDSGKLLKFIEEDKNAISFAVFDASGYNNIKILTVDGVPATDVARIGGLYLLSTELMLVTHKDRSLETSKFIKYFVYYAKQNSLSNFAKINILDEKNE